MVTMCVQYSIPQHSIVCYSVDNLSGLLELNDWIFDVHWLSYTSLESYELVLITAHNDVTLVKHSFTDTLATVVARCETRCILYP